MTHQKSWKVLETVASHLNMLPSQEICTRNTNDFVFLLYAYAYMTWGEHKKNIFVRLNTFMVMLVLMPSKKKSLDFPPKFFIFVLIFFFQNKSCCCEQDSNLRGKPHWISSLKP